ncbi:MAG: hypothetical protein AVDCRST_MAG48-452 [uncultured Friedmanniella sp.]|uniref:Uncharacterized protein n=1 Tax=uncultured Friedmanniella sp. TaxID=335381 RepID=A0A6J4JXK9_9ACTN|nr:MAG: hypothetical protein AVDCRST_MAG48-452 [uncultured Friedmanniella sp.]
MAYHRPERGWKGRGRGVPEWCSGRDLTSSAGHEEGVSAARSGTAVGDGRSLTPSR